MTRACHNSKIHNQSTTKKHEYIQVKKHQISKQNHSKTCMDPSFLIYFDNLTKHQPWQEHQKFSRGGRDGLYIKVSGDVP